MEIKRIPVIKTMPVRMDRDLNMITPCGRHKALTEKITFLRMKKLLIKKVTLDQDTEITPRNAVIDRKMRPVNI